MLKFINNSSGFMGLTLTTLGLFIASGILLLVVCSLVFSNPWQEIEELHEIARDISTRIQDMDSRFYESTILFQCPPSKFQYAFRVSTEYITVIAKSTWGDTIAMRERFVVHPWPRNDTFNWTTGADLHRFLNETYGHWGTQEDPLPFMNLSELERDREECATFLALHPIGIRSNIPLYIEKISIFDDTGEKYDFILLYQTG
jgi:hypothetical protein